LIQPFRCPAELCLQLPLFSFQLSYLLFDGMRSHGSAFFPVTLW
jgi:hypothetical protein